MNLTATFNKSPLYPLPRAVETNNDTNRDRESVNTASVCPASYRDRANKLTITAEVPPGTIAVDTIGSPVELTLTSSTAAREARKESWRTGDESKLSFDSPLIISDTAVVNK